MKKKIFSIGLIVILVIAIGVIKIFPIKVRDFGDVAMPYINTGLNSLIYLLITNTLSLFKIKQDIE